MFFWNSLAFLRIRRILAIWSLVPLPFLNPVWTSGSSQFTCCWSLAWRILSITLLVCEMSAIVHSLVWAFFGIAFLWDWNEKWPFPVLWPLLSFPNYSGQAYLRRNGLAIIVKKKGKERVWNAVLGCNLKNGRTISVHFQGKPFNITVIQVYALASNAEEAEVEQFYEDLQGLLELTPKKDVLFIIGDWNAKVGSQEIPGIQVNLALEYRMKEGKG